MTLRKLNHRPAHAVRWPVPSEPLAGHEMHDYADCFEVPLSAADERTAEQVFRAGLEGAPPALRRIIVAAHRHVLRFRLGPASSPTHVLGWQIISNEPDAIRLEASGPLARGVLVAQRSPASSAVLHTFVYYRRAHARAIWAFTAPVHRAIARYLLKRAAQGSS
jgi:hypothetical protein